MIYYKSKLGNYYSKNYWRIKTREARKKSLCIKCFILGKKNKAINNCYCLFHNTKSLANHAKWRLTSAYKKYLKKEKCLIKELTKLRICGYCRKRKIFKGKRCHRCIENLAKSHIKLKYLTA